MSIGIVIVTYNRIEKLKKALDRYNNQTVFPKYILVVNNCSNDGTTNYLKEWENTKSKYEKYTINLRYNTGGSGGFYEGLKKSLELTADWIWVSDDDAYPHIDAVENAKKYIENKEDVVSVCSAVVSNGKIDCNHRMRIKRGVFCIQTKGVKRKEYAKESFYIDMFSYVGSIINKKYLAKVGLPIKEYFIHYDDIEHSFRLSKLGKIVCVPKIKVVHDVAIEKEIDWKMYYDTRNKLDFYRKHFSKRYYYYLYYRINIVQKCKTFLKKIMKRNTTFNKMVLCATRDAKIGKLGFNEEYTLNLNCKDING